MTSAYATRDNLIQAVLEELKVVAYGQPASAEEYNAVDERLDSLLAELSSRNIYSVGNPDAIPNEALGALSQAIARQIATRFSIEQTELNNMFPAEDHPYSPESRLRSISRARPVNAPSQPDYF